MRELPPDPTALAGRSPGLALFVDFDGTVVELAERPDAVTVGLAVTTVLHRLHQGLGGALALVSGRSISTLDAFLGLPGLGAAGLHGLERRSAGASYRPEPKTELDAARTHLAPLLDTHPELLLEDKVHSLALHYRAAPALAPRVRAAMQACQAKVPGFHLMEGKMVLELKPAQANKACAVAWFMRQPEFRGARPIFLGDDVTDEDGFAWVQRHGGFGVKVGAGASQATFGLPDVAHVIEWLGALACRTSTSE